MINWWANTVTAFLFSGSSSSWKLDTESRFSLPNKSQTSCRPAFGLHGICNCLTRYDLCKLPAQWHSRRNDAARWYIQTFSAALFAKAQLLSGKPQLKQQPCRGHSRRRFFSRTTTSFSRHTIWPTGPLGSSARKKKKKRLGGISESGRCRPQSLN